MWLTVSTISASFIRYLPFNVSVNVKRICNGFSTPCLSYWELGSARRREGAHGCRVCSYVLIEAIQLIPGIKKPSHLETVRAFFAISDKKRCVPPHRPVSFLSTIPIMVFICSTAGCSCSSVGTPRKRRSAATFSTNCMARRKLAVVVGPVQASAFRTPNLESHGPRGPLRNGACRSARGYETLRNGACPPDSCFLNGGE